MTIKYWGFSSIEVELLPIADCIREVQEIATLRPTHWRLMVAWNYVATSSNSTAWDWSTVDRIIEVIVQNGITPMLIIGQGVPKWVQTSERATQYGLFCAAVATRYGTSGGPFGKICTIYEAWNEENEDVFWGGNVNPTNYDSSLVAAYNAIKGVSGLSGSNSTVVWGGLQPVPAVGPWFGAGWITDTPIDFVQRCFTANPNIGNYFDVLALHPYTDLNFAHSGTYEPLITQDCFVQVQEIINFLAAKGLTQPIWITETGFSTANMTEALQNSYMQEEWALIETQFPQIEMFLIYNARNHGTSATNVDQNYGVMRYDFSQKPIWNWLETLSFTITPPPGIVSQPTAPIPVIGAGIAVPPAIVVAPTAPVPSIPTNPPGVSFDSAGAGAWVTGGSGSQAHTLGATADCLIVGLEISHQNIFSYGSYTTLEVLCGTTALTEIVSEDFGLFATQPKSSVHWFALLDPPTGGQTISWDVVPPSGNIGSVMMRSLAYIGVGSIENAAQVQDFNADMNINVLSETGDMAVVCAGFRLGSVPSGFNQTVRYSNSGTDSIGSRAIILGDAPGNMSVNFTTSSSSSYGAVGINLKAA